MEPLLLFVDDDPNDCEIAVWQLSRVGIRVEHRVVQTERELIAALAERLPALVLSDIVLPQWNCWAAWRVCQEHAPGVPFALYSGTVGVRDMRLAHERDLIGTAEKDLPAQLVDVVRRALRAA